MKIIRVNMKKQIDNKQDLCACIGFFDGLHVGHQRLVSNVIEKSKETGWIPTLITFDPDPIIVIRKLASMKHIMTLQDKIDFSESLGIECVVILEIDQQMQQLSPQEFVESILVPLRIKHLVCGFDFRFGFKGAGTAITLKEYPHLFGVDVIDEVDYQNQKISSTRIIESLKNGNVCEVKRLLGRPYTISGTIIAGNQKGRDIGFPTANMALNPEYHQVKEGVYITEMTIDTKTYPSMTNVGHNLTFNTSEDLSIETTILDFNEMIYGKQVKLSFHQYLRPEMKFNTIQELINQMCEDEKKTRAYFQ